MTQLLDLPQVLLGVVVAYAKSGDVHSISRVCKSFRLIAFKHSSTFNRLSFSTRAWRHGGGLQGFASTLEAVALAHDSVVRIQLTTSAPNWREAMDVISGWGNRCALHLVHDSCAPLPAVVLNTSTNLSSFDSVVAYNFDGSLSLPATCLGARFGRSWSLVPQRHLRQLVLRDAFIREEGDVVDLDAFNFVELFPTLEVLHLGHDNFFLEHVRCSASLRVLVVDAVIEGGLHSLQSRLPGLQTLICPRIEPLEHLLHTGVRTVVTSYYISSELDFAPPHLSYLFEHFPSLAFFWGHARWDTVYHNSVGSDDEGSDYALVPKVWHMRWSQEMARLEHMHLLIDTPDHVPGHDIPVLTTVPVVCPIQHACVSLSVGGSDILSLFEKGDVFTPPEGVRWDTSWRNWLPASLFTSFCDKCGVGGMPALPWGL